MVPARWQNSQSAAPGPHAGPGAVPVARRRRLSQSRSGRGFTLIELIIVIIILGILSVFAAPRFIGTSGIDEVAAQSEVVALLREVQQRAMQDTANPCYGVAFDNDTGQVEFFSPADCNIPSPDLNPVQLADGLSFGLNDPGGLAADARFLFNARGCPVPASHADSAAADVFAEPCGQAPLEVLISGSTTRELCIRSQGYITTAACP